MFKVISLSLLVLSVSCMMPARTAGCRDSSDPRLAAFSIVTGEPGGVIHGLVVSAVNGASLPNAEILMDQDLSGVFSDSLGFFEIRVSGRPSVLLRTRLNGFEYRRDTIRLSEGVAVLVPLRRSFAESSACGVNILTR